MTSGEIFQMNFYAGNSLAKRIDTIIKVLYAPVQGDYQPRERDAYCNNCPELFAHGDSIVQYRSLNNTFVSHQRTTWQWC